jgi:hypothetical protein
VSLPLARPFKLAGPHGDGRNPYVNADGAFIGRGVPLLERDTVGHWRPRDEAVLERLLTAGYGTPITQGRCIARLRHVAELLNDGHLALAQISLLRMQLPPLPSAEHARAMARADGVIAKENPDWEDEPRVPTGNPDGGEWTDENEGSPTKPDAEIIPAAAQVDATQAKKERFVDTHLADAQKAADRLGVPIENVLGAAAVESAWGRSRFAIQGKNLFGLYYPAPYATGYLPAHDNPRAKLAIFATYGDSFQSFATTVGPFARGIGDPTAFAAALQNSGKFGIDPTTGRKRPEYKPSVAATIRGLRPIIARHGA